MKIVIDMQGAQTEFSRYRGVGRYTMGLVKALIKNQNDHQFILALNGVFSDSVDFIRAEFDELLEQKNILVWQQYYDCTAINPYLQANKKVGEIIREIFLNSLEGDIIFSTNLQEGLFENAVTSVGNTTKKSFFCSTLHDLTPLIYPERYLCDTQNSKWYFEKLEAVKKSDIIVTVSNYSKQRIIDLLKIPEYKIHVVYNAVDKTIFNDIKNNILEQARETIVKRFNIDKNFLIYAGGADFHKNLVRLYEAYSKIPILIRKEYQLVMVGREIKREEALHLEKLKKLGIEQDIIFAGYVSDNDLALLYNLCSCFVFPSIEEGFGLPPLEAMACGAPVIGSNIASIPEVIGFADALFNPFDSDDMADKIIKVLTDKSFRNLLSNHGIKQAQKFNWQNSSAELLSILEHFMQNNMNPFSKYDDPVAVCIDEIEKLEEYKNIPSSDLLKFAASLADTFEVTSKPKLLLDMSSIKNSNDRTGIQRVALAICKHLMDMNLDYLVIPVYTSPNEQDFYVANSIIDLINNHKSVQNVTQDEYIEFNNGDILVFLDLHPLVAISHIEKIKFLRNKGIFIYHVIYDLLPVEFESFFWSDLCEEFKEWLKTISKSDGVLCISKTVANTFEQWYQKNIQPQRRKFQISWFHLGADVENSVLSKGLPDDSYKLLDLLKNNISFLMVGTLEPRKGYSQILQVFEKLWQEGINVNLVIVGKKGWSVEELSNKIKSNHYIDKYLFWLDNISDEYLELIYASSSALIAASYGEGFGLPLIEAAQHKIPIIARDIAVFREVAENYAFYFPNSSDNDLILSYIKKWIILYKNNEYPKSDEMKFLSWKDSSQMFFEKIQKMV